MTPTKRLTAFGRSCTLALALAGLTPAAAFAQAGECNGFINISYPNFPPAPLEVPPPKDVELEIAFGTGSITGGINNVLILSAFKFNMACNADFPLIGPDTNCVPDGPPGFPPPKVEFVGMVQPVCAGRTFTPSVGGVGNNVVTFTANSPIVIPAGQSTLPGFCSIRFKVRVVQGFSSDAISPSDIEETVNYAIAACDNGVLVSGGTQTASIPVATPGNPFISYEIKRQGVMMATGGTIDIPALGVIGEPIDASAKATAKRLMTPALPANVNGDHLLAFESKRQGTTGGGFPLPPQNGRVVTVTTKEFGQVTKSLGSPWMVLINAKKDLLGPIPPEPLTDVYACYTIDGSQGVRLSWEDQFGKATGNLRRNAAICFPASLQGTTPPAIPLFCVHGQWASGGRPPGYKPEQVVFIGSAWLSEKEKLEGLDEYCAAVTQLTVAP